MLRCYGTLFRNPNQRGFTNSFGTHINIAILDCLLRENKTNGKDLAVIFIDIWNAFDNIGHNHLRNTLNALPIPTKLTNLVFSLQTGNITTIQSKNDKTKPITIVRGVLQGSPLSPTLFNLCIDHILNELSEHCMTTQYGFTLSASEYQLTVMGFADDIVIIDTRKVWQVLREKEFENWSQKKHKGKGMLLYEQYTPANKWIRNHKGLFCSEWREAIKMNANITAVRSVLGKSSGSNLCRRCDREVETLAHVLGACPHGELLRNARHHTVRSIITNALRNKGYSVYEEVHGISSEGSNRRIDIIAFKPPSLEGLFGVDGISWKERFPTVLSERTTSFINIVRSKNVHNDVAIQELRNRFVSLGTSGVPSQIYLLNSTTYFCHRDIIAITRIFLQDGLFRHYVTSSSVNEVVSDYYELWFPNCFVTNDEKHGQVVVITEDVQNGHLLLEYSPHIDVSLTCEHDPKLQEYCVCPQNMPQFDSEGIPNQAPETNKPMILNGPTSRNREGSDQMSVEAKQLGHLYLSIDQETFDPSTGEPYE
ncbi:hypothetical protein ANN_19349 [Periplaneta americana]|uniref:Reverse transcriptase domain-containing protein n=1 Tax=Periplaneta americana TaxID=6978 RepID=A0ABQ8S9W0_PERAM|nr:hypothetical protein ANN_19349 [Periplaneta americana]